MIALLPMELKNARDRLQNFESEIPDIVPNHFDGEHPDFPDKDTQVIDSVNNYYTLLPDSTVKAGPAGPAGPEPNYAAPYLACTHQTQYFSRPLHRSFYTTVAPENNAENWPTASVPSSTQAYEYIEARPGNFLRSQLGVNLESISATVSDSPLPGVISDEQMAEILGSVDICFGQSRGSFGLQDLL